MGRLLLMSSMRFVILGTVAHENSRFRNGIRRSSDWCVFAEMGQNLICYDLDESKIHLLSEMTAPFYEPGLEDLIERNVLAGRLHFSANLPFALKNARYCLVCVPTPQSPNGECDLQYIFSAIDSLCQHIEHDLVTIIKSTIPVGTKNC